MQELGLDRWIVKMCEKLNFHTPTQIQKATIPAVLQGKNVLAHSETGSGKTACFAFPALQTLARDPFSVCALILTPNRELAFQIHEQIVVFGSNINVRVATIVGGMDMLNQKSAVEQYPHFVIATPGRLVDQLDRDPQLRELLGNLKYLILDEVDRLLDDTIIDDIKNILTYLPENRQTVLTTATLTAAVEENIELLTGNDKEIVKFEVNKKKKTVESLTQQMVFVPEQVKEYYFIHLVKMFQEKTCIIFVSNCKKCQTICMLLKELGFEATSLHSYLPQRQRIVNLKKFRNERVKILVATDVASRGLDIQMVDLVINLDIPYNADDYIHRVGRTARKGKRGLAISVVTQYEIDLILNIEKSINDKLEPLELPEKEVLDFMTEITKAKNKVKIRMYESGMAEEYEQLSEDRKLMKKNIQKTEKIQKPALPKKLQEKKKELIQNKKNKKASPAAIEN